jgi:hypothetical protein
MQLIALPAIEIEQLTMKNALGKYIVSLITPCKSFIV